MMGRQKNGVSNMLKIEQYYNSAKDASSVISQKAIHL